MKDDVFSPYEKKVLKILGSRKMTITELTFCFFDSEPSAQQEHQNQMAGILRRIERKCEINKLNWTLKREGPGGRGGLTIWKESI